MRKHPNCCTYIVTHLETTYTAEIGKSCDLSCETSNIVSNFVDVVQVITAQSKTLYVVACITYFLIASCLGELSLVHSQEGSLVMQFLFCTQYWRDL